MAVSINCLSLWLVKMWFCYLFWISFSILDIMVQSKRNFTIMFEYVHQWRAASFNLFCAWFSLGKLEGLEVTHTRNIEWTMQDLFWVIHIYLYILPAALNQVGFAIYTWLLFWLHVSARIICCIIFVLKAFKMYWCIFTV